MRKKKGFGRFLCALLCAAVLTGGAEGQAAKKDDLKRQNEEDEQNLDDLEDQVNELSEEQDGIDSEIEALSNEIAEIMASISLLEEDSEERP